MYHIGSVRPNHISFQNLSPCWNKDEFWLRDESLEDTANLPDPDVLAAEIIEDLQAALEQFGEIAEDVGA